MGTILVSASLILRSDNDEVKLTVPTKHKTWHFKQNAYVPDQESLTRRQYWWESFHKITLWNSSFYATKTVLFSVVT